MCRLLNSPHKVSPLMLWTASRVLGWTGLSKKQKIAMFDDGKKYVSINLFVRHMYVHVENGVFYMLGYCIVTYSLFIQ